MSARLLLVEDESNLAFLLSERLDREGYQVETCPDGEQGLIQAASGAYDLAILDLMLPGRSGFEICRELRRRGIDLPILMLTARGETEQRIDGLERGADDYLAKPFEPRELMLRLSSLVRRTTSARPPVHREVRMGECIFDPERGELTRSGKRVKLTASEIQLLKLFAANAGRSFSRSQLCSRLNIVLERSVDVQVTRLRRKIEEDPKLPLYIQTVRGVGYVLVPDRVG